MTKREHHDIGILIIDNNVKLCELLKEVFDSEEGIEVVGVAHDGIQALEMIEEKNPDIILLDVVMPRLDGMGVLTQLSTHKLSRRPRIIMLTVLETDELIEEFKAYGVDSYVIKPFDIYELIDKIHRLCRDLADGPFNYKVRDSRNYIISSYSLDNDESLYSAIGELLYILGVPTYRKGYIYLREAIFLATKEPERLTAVTTLIFPRVAEKFSTTSSGVQAAVRNAIKNIWKNTDRRRLRDVFGLELLERCLYDPPSNGEFIANVVETLQVAARRGK